MVPAGACQVIDVLKPYPAYKDSGALWLGEVPQHWDVRRFRNVAEMRVSNVDKHTNEGEFPVRLCNYVDVYKHDRIHLRMPFMHATASADEIARFHLEIGDVLITKDSEVWTDIGVPALVRETANDLICGYHLALLRPLRNRICGDYLFRALQSPAVAYQFHVEANGVTRFGLSHSAIKAISLTLPPLPEQAAIVRFLDHVDRRIRRYIRTKQKVIKLLEEQKQVIIHRAVTRGVHDNVHLKCSGLEWLGQIPEHWEIRRNGQLFVQRNQTGFPELPILEVSLKTGVRIRDVDNSTRKQIMSDRTKYKRAARGDIAYNMMRMWQGAVGVCPVDGLVSPAYVVARPFNDIEARYYSNLFRTTAYMGEVDRHSRGIVKDRNRLYWEDFKQIASPYPPPDEQVRIADAIEQQTATVDETMAKVAHEIDLIREYRSRLIADVVTGKLDVREAAARLPDEQDERESLDEADALDEGEKALNESDLDTGAAEDRV